MQSTARRLRAVPAAAGGLETLFREHHDRVFRAAYRVTGSATDAEDVLQTVFLRLAGRGEKLDLSPSPASYLHRAAVNASLDLLRQKSRSRFYPIETFEDARAGSRVSPDRQHDEEELRQKVRESVAQLGDRAGEVIALKYFEGYGNREIAQMLGTSQMVVGVILHRARGRLRKEIGKFMEERHETN